jgi:hypothetical protein
MAIKPSGYIVADLDKSTTIVVPNSLVSTLKNQGEKSIVEMQSILDELRVIRRKLSKPVEPIVTVNGGGGSKSSIIDSLFDLADSFGGGDKKNAKGGTSKLGRAASVASKVGVRALGVAGAAYGLYDTWQNRNSQDTTDVALQYGGNALSGAMLGASVAGPVGAVVGAGVGLLTTYVMRNWDSWSSSITSMWNSFKDTVSSSWSAFSGNVSETWEKTKYGIVEGFKVGGPLGAVIGASLSVLSPILEPMWSSVKESADRKWTDFKSYAEERKEDVKRKWNDLLGNIFELFNKLKDWFGVKKDKSSINADTKNEPSSNTPKPSTNSQNPSAPTVKPKSGGKDEPLDPKSPQALEIASKPKTLAQAGSPVMVAELDKDGKETSTKVNMSSHRIADLQRVVATSPNKGSVEKAKSTLVALEKSNPSKFADAKMVTEARVTQLKGESEGALFEGNGAKSKELATQSEKIKNGELKFDGSEIEKPISDVKPVDTKDIVQEKQGEVASIRKLAINETLKDQLTYATSQAGEGLTFRVTSGGQAAKGTQGKRTGSVRHDVDEDGKGQSADGELVETATGRILSKDNPEDYAKMQKFMEKSVEAGATGIGFGGVAGAGNYMGSSRMHIGGGTPSAWGGDAASKAGALPEITALHARGMEAQKTFGANGLADWKAKNNNSLNQFIQQSQVVDPHSDHKHGPNGEELPREQLSAQEKFANDLKNKSTSILPQKDRREDLIKRNGPLLGYAASLSNDSPENIQKRLDSAKVKKNEESTVKNNQETLKDITVSAKETAKSVDLSKDVGVQLSNQLNKDAKLTDKTTGDALKDTRESSTILNRTANKLSVLGNYESELNNPLSPSQPNSATKPVAFNVQNSTNFNYKAANSNIPYTVSPSTVPSSSPLDVSDTLKAPSVSSKVSTETETVNALKESEPKAPVKNEDKKASNGERADNTTNHVRMADIPTNITRLDKGLGALMTTDAA